jgi:signal transduction histidine kinase
MIKSDLEEILIIDDDALNTGIIKNILLSASYKTLSANQGCNGIEIAKTKLPDLILLDIIMPDIDGFETCRILKADKLTKDIPVIFISALDKTFDKVKAFNVGAIDFISKPIQEEELLARIKTHIKINKFEKQIVGLNTELSEKNYKLNSTLENLTKTQALLLHAEKMSSLGILTAGIAHEINNPVNYINLGSNNLARDYKILSEILKEYFQYEKYFPVHIQTQINSYKQQKYLSEILNNVSQTIVDINFGTERIIEIIKSLNIFLYNDKQEKKNVNINLLIDTALVLLKNKYKHSIKIFKEYYSGELIFECFPGQLNQVFVNIINNAIDAIEGQGSIFIKTERIIEDEQIIISIKDTGKGMSSEIQNQIFDPFFTTKDIGKGMGLGLFLTYEIIKKHNGEINVVSVQDKFTEFKIILPLKYNIDKSDKV